MYLYILHTHTHTHKHTEKDLERFEIVVSDTKIPQHTCDCAVNSSNNHTCGARVVNVRLELVPRIPHRTCGCVVNWPHKRTCGPRAVPCGILALIPGFSVHMHAHTLILTLSSTLSHHTNSPGPSLGHTSGRVWCGKRLVVVSLAMTGGL